VNTSIISLSSRRVTALASLAAGLTLSLLSVSPAYAVLGGAPMTPPAGATVNNAVSHAAVSAVASAAGASASSYTVRTTTLAVGTVVNEYVGADGVVFGIAWQGPRIPDLPTLLGSYFPQYVQGIQNQRANGGGRGPSAWQAARWWSAPAVTWAHSPGRPTCRSPCPRASAPATSNNGRRLLLCVRRFPRPIRPCVRA
jgi:hypothetical protein